MSLRTLAALGDRSDVYRDARRMAVIDMGSNSWRLIVVEYVPGVSFKVTDEVQESVRLGEGMSELPVLRPAAMDRAARAAQIYAAFCEASGIANIHAAATSAIRDASNQKRFLQRIERESGLQAHVLSGEEEAYYGYLAAVNSTTLENGFVLDMGGGSLQISRVENRRPVQQVSFPMGAVRMTEAFLRSDPVTSREAAALAEHVREQLQPLGWLRAEPGMRLIGEGGNVRLAARLMQKKAGYPLDILHGYALSYGQVYTVRDELQHLSIAQRRRLPGMKAERADIALASAIVLQEIMRLAEVEAVEIGAQGLREGIFYEHFFEASGPDRVNPPLFEDVRRASVLNLCHVYRFQERHADHIAHITGQMAAQIPDDLRSFDADGQALLWAAAMLHDIGVVVDYHDHHKHGSYLILNAGLPGYTHRELALIALLVRYHRKGQPQFDELAALMRPGDDEVLMQLSALLRLAEQIDRARDGGVRDVRLAVDGDRARLELFTSGDERVALWAVERHREFFHAAFGIDLEVVPVPVDGA